MADYSPQYVKTMDVRNFFNPPLDYNDVPEAEILIKIEVIEKYIEDVYELSSSSDVRLPALLLVASKIVYNPALAQKYHTLRMESFRGDYTYELGSADTNPFSISESWSQMAHKMLRAKSSIRNDYKWRIYISNS